MGNSTKEVLDVEKHLVSRAMSQENRLTQILAVPLAVWSWMSHFASLDLRCYIDGATKGVNFIQLWKG